MNSFFDKLKDFFREGIRRIRKVANAAADKIDETAEELSRRINAAVADVKKTAADAFRSCKNAFKRPAGTADSGTGQTGTNDGTTSRQSAERESESRNGENDGARQTESSGATKSATDGAGVQHEHGGRHHHTKARRLLVFVVDFLAGLLFFSAVVIAVKPQLLGAALHIQMESIQQNDISPVIEMSEKVGSYLIQIKVSQTIPPKLKIARNVFVALFLALYVVLKIVVVLLAKSPVSQKTVSALMIALTILACALLADKFWIFTAICLIASFAFAFSCGFPARTIFRKFAVFAVIALCCYVEAHILADYAGCRETLHEMRKALVQFGEKTAAFLMALRFPLQA